MDVLNKIRGVITRIMQKSSLILRIAVKFLLFYLLFRHISQMDCFASETALAGTLFNSRSVQLVLAAVSALLPNRAGVLISLFLIIYNLYQTSVIGCVIVGLMLILLYVVEAGFFPDQAFLLVLVPFFIEWKMYLLVPLFSGLYMGVTAVVPMVLGVLMYGVIGILPAFTDLQLDGALSELPALIADASSSGVSSITSNDQLKYLMILSALVTLLISLLRMLHVNYSRYIAIGASGIAGLILMLVYIAQGKIEGPSGTCLLLGLLSLGLLLFVEFLHVSANYKEARSLEFEDDDFIYQVRMVPKMGISFGPITSGKSPAGEIADQVKKRQAHRQQSTPHSTASSSSGVSTTTQTASTVSSEARARAAAAAQRSVSEREYKLSGARVATKNALHRAADAEETKESSENTATQTEDTVRVDLPRKKKTQNNPAGDGSSEDRPEDIFQSHSSTDERP